MTLLCPGCDKPPPAEWCWVGRLDCPCNMPPKNLSVMTLWRELADLRKRVAALEDPLIRSWDGVITLRRRDTTADPVTPGEMEDGLRTKYGWPDEMFTDDMRAMLSDIATSLNTREEAGAPDSRQ